MKTSKFQSEGERDILIGMIVHDQVLARIYASQKDRAKSFRTKSSNTIAKWCLDFYAKYEKAPKGHIRPLYEKFAMEHDNDATSRLIAKHLEALSNDYTTVAEEINPDFLIDQASRYFNLVAMEELSEKLQQAIEKKDPDEAAKHLAEFSPVRFESSAGIDVMTDHARMKEAFDSEESEVLLRYPGALGEFFGEQLHRGAFVSFMAPDKTGKSFWLQDMAWRAATIGKRRTLLISIGDMTDKQMLRRIGVRATRRPKRAKTIQWPTSVKRDADETAQREMVSKTFELNLTPDVIQEAMERCLKKCSTKRSTLRLYCFASINITGIRAILDECIRDNWIPEALVVDYADELSAEPGTSKMDERAQINVTWRAFRQTTLDYHLLGITATQSDAAAYGAKIITRKNFSNDKRKMAHVTGMIGINQNDEEKAIQTVRLNWVVLREDEFVSTKLVTVSGCLDVANPAMASCW